MPIVCQLSVRILLAEVLTWFSPDINSIIIRKFSSSQGHRDSVHIYSNSSINSHILSPTFISSVRVTHYTWTNVEAHYSYRKWFRIYMFERIRMCSKRASRRVSRCGLPFSEWMLAIPLRGEWYLFHNIYTHSVYKLHVSIGTWRFGGANSNSVSSITCEHFLEFKCIWISCGNQKSRQGHECYINAMQGWTI